MKFGAPLLSTKLSGALGGVVGATARGGVGYFRRRVDGSNPSSVQQTITRSIMATLSAAWQTVLTSPQRAAWAAKADPTESGIDVYTRGNFQQLLSGGYASTPTAPASPALDNTPIVDSGTYDISDGTWTVAVPADTGTAWNVFVTTFQPASQLSRSNSYTWCQFVEADQTEIAFLGITDKLDGIAAGQVFYVRMVPFGHTGKLGRVGQAQEFRVLAVV